MVHLLVNGSATTDLGQLSASGFVLGLPSVKPAPWDRKSYPLDRGIRALRGGNWACLLLAEPVPETHVNKERDAVIEELKDIPEVNRTTPELPDLRPSLRRPTPLPDEPQEKPNVLGSYYKELLIVQLQTLIACLGAGAWRTAMYLAGDATYYRLASVWEESFPGKKLSSSRSGCGREISIRLSIIGPCRTLDLTLDPAACRDCWSTRQF